MGTTLTGTKPKDTYDSLIKVEDNGPISGTAKYLSDGLGNNLPIAVSTSNVGIGTSAPDTLVTLGTTARTDNTAGIKIFRGGGTASYATYGFSGNAVINSVGGDLVMQRESSERARFTTAGLCFNGDFAAANALDDYEEGTWTMAVAPSTSGTITLDAGVNAGSYTKIGRQVTVTGLAEVSAVSLPVGTAIVMSGLPFAIAARSVDYDSRIGGAVAVSSGGVNLPRAFLGFETLSSFSIYVDASTISAGNQIYISFTYIV